MNCEKNGTVIDEEKKSDVQPKGPVCTVQLYTVNSDNHRQEKWHVHFVNSVRVRLF